MERTARIRVAKTVTLQTDATGLPEAVTEDVNQDGQETPVIIVNILSNQQIN